MRSSVRPFLAGVAALLVSGVGAVADATTVLFLDRAELVKISPVVARVVVGKSVTGPSDDGTTVVTRTELSVKQIARGKSPATLVVEQIGGTYKGRTHKVIGDGRLTTGEDAVVFLAAGDGKVTYLSVLAQSVYHVENGMVRRDLDGLNLMSRAGGKIGPVATPPEPPETVDHLMADVTRIAGGK